ENVDYQSNGRLCNLSFLEYLKLYFFEYEHVAVNSTRHGLDIATIGNPACLAALAVLVIRASQSRQHDTLVRLPMDIRLKIDLRKSVDVLMSLIHIECTSHLPQFLFDVGTGRISIITVNTVRYHSDVLAISQG
ncbi:hypothetical protein Tco_1063205, partial [Tanacetum coccineum]